METIIAYVDDAAHAWPRLIDAAPAHWVLVACAPRMTHRISKWVSHRARENWRIKWADRLFAQLVPGLDHRGHRVTPLLATGPLSEFTTQLQAEHPVARVLDLRRPRQSAFGPADSEVWRAPGSALGLGALFTLMAE